MALVAAIWKCSALKADTSEKWAARVSILKAGLDELATVSLTKLRDQIGDLVGPDGAFDPNTVVTNPARLRGQVGRFLKFLRTRNRVGVYFQTMLLVGPAIMIACCILLFALAPIFVEISGLHKVNDLVSSISFWTAVPATIVAALGFFAFVISQHLLGNAEVMVTRKLNDE